MADVDYDALDPGIRETVRLLRAHGFDTTDSGDGVTKPHGEGVLDFPHVAACTTRERLFADADRMAAVLGEGWHVEATYFPGGGQCLLLATQ